MTSYIHEIYNEMRLNMTAMKAVLHNLYFLVTLPLPGGHGKNLYFGL